MSALAMAPFEAGLTNQKLALVGLALRARAERRAVALPRLVDFVPGGASGTVALGEVLDEAAVAAGLRAFGVRVADDGDTKDPAPLFANASRAFAECRRADDAAGFAELCRLLAAMRPCDAVAALVPQVAAVGLQLRVERDWQDYAARLAPSFPNEALYLDHRAILARVTETLGTGLTLLATCNLADLPEPPARMRADAAMLGQRLLFRPDVGPRHLGRPLADAAFDFALAGSLPRIVGHSRSTFFNALALTRHGDGAAGEAWLYNVGGPRLKRRTDDGAFVRPWAATAA